MNGTTRIEGSDLVISRRIAAAPEAIWTALTEAGTLRQWFAPRPWQVTRCLIEPRPGGRFELEMQGPDGQPEDCVAEGEADPGACVLEAEAPRRLVWTDAMSGGYRPNEKPFMTAVITLEPDGDECLGGLVCQLLAPQGQPPGGPRRGE